jgi:hypothetical protein
MKTYGKGTAFHVFCIVQFVRLPKTRRHSFTLQINMDIYVTLPNSNMPTNNKSEIGSTYRLARLSYAALH